MHAIVSPIWIRFYKVKKFLELRQLITFFLFFFFFKRIYGSKRKKENNFGRRGFPNMGFYLRNPRQFILCTQLLELRNFNQNYILISFKLFPLPRASEILNSKNNFFPAITTIIVFLHHPQSLNDLFFHLFHYQFINQQSLMNFSSFPTIVLYGGLWKK